MEGIVMKNDYPIKNRNQHEHPKLSYQDYINVSGKLFATDSSDLSADIEIEMSNSVFAMRRELKRTVKKLRNLYVDKKSDFDAVEFDNTDSPMIPFVRMHLVKRHAIG